ncbi:MAG: class I SAM-dependent methyltransferase [Gammaproteobacteria bacterium]|nr:class I SAM-dependent methyltransferase [Gammaproteobacteria bacterium]
MQRQELFKMMQAYKQTSLLRAGVKLGVFDHLAEGPTDIELISQRIGADARGTRILLNALAAIQICETDGERFWISKETADLLVRDRPKYAGDMVHVFASDWEWDALKRITEAVRYGGTVLEENAETPDYKFWKDFASYATVVAEPTAAILINEIEPWARTREELKVLDMACGHGVYGYTVAQRYERAEIWSLDWDSVLPIALQHAARMGVANRVHSIAGDMFETFLGDPYDLVLVTNVLHHFSEARATQLLKRARSVLKPGGRLGIVGFTKSAKSSPAEDPAPYLFDILMLAWTARGEVHSLETYAHMLAAAGFNNIAHRSVPELPFHVLVANNIDE